MPDARILREITDALRALASKADEAGSPTLRVLISMTAETETAAAEARTAEREPRATRPAEMMRRLADS